MLPAVPELEGLCRFHTRDCGTSDDTSRVVMRELVSAPTSSSQLSASAKDVDGRDGAQP